MVKRFTRYELLTGWHYCSGMWDLRSKCKSICERWRCRWRHPI